MWSVLLGQAASPTVGSGQATTQNNDTGTHGGGDRTGVVYQSAAKKGRVEERRTFKTIWACPDR